jgi:uncharacterized iron-regulated membrane protein
MLKTSIQLHKWIGLVVFIQVLFWVLGGLVMTAIPIETVHGDKHLAQAPATAIPADGVLPLTEAAKKAGFELAKAQLRSTPNGPVWILDAPSGQQRWLNAKTGEDIEEITEAEAKASAAAAYAGKGRPVKAVLLDEPPPEAMVQGPLWQVKFDDGEGTTLYLDPFTGDVASRRSDVWRFYDFFFRLHIMNFGPAETYNHPLIIAASAVTLLVVLTGIVLLWFRVGRDVRGWLARRKARAA